MIDSAKAELLNEYFVPVGTIDNGVLPDIQPLASTGTFLDNIDFGTDKIHKEIKQMKANESSGPDGYPPILIKKLAPSLVTPLSLFTALSYQ